MENKLTPFGQAVYDDMTPVEVERELLPVRHACERESNAEICQAWNMTRGERLEQLELVAKMKYAERLARLAR